MLIKCFADRESSKKSSKITHYLQKMGKYEYFCRSKQKKMTTLSVNINKVATLRNSRGGNTPDVLQAAKDCEKFGAQGITVHPRPDARHIRYSDVREIRPIVTTQMNIEGNPIDAFCDLVLEVCPHQVTLVPDSADTLTSNAGWDTVEYSSFLTDICKSFKSKGIRTSIFVDPSAKMVEGAARCGADRVELYTGPYAEDFKRNPQAAIAPYYKAARIARETGLDVNAGHDLNLDNLHYFIQTIPWTAEVSIGHAIICDALYLGMEKTIAAYLREISRF